MVSKFRRKQCCIIPWQSYKIPCWPQRNSRVEHWIEFFCISFFSQAFDNIVSPQLLSWHFQGRLYCHVCQSLFGFIDNSCSLSLVTSLLLPIILWLAVIFSNHSSFCTFCESVDNQCCPFEPRGNVDITGKVENNMQYIACYYKRVKKTKIKKLFWGVSHVIFHLKS